MRAAVKTRILDPELSESLQSTNFAIEGWAQFRVNGFNFGVLI